MIGKYQTASSFVSEMRSKLIELRTLAIGAANEGGNSKSAQAAYAATADYIISSYNYILETAEYNGMNLLDGSDGPLAEVGELEGVDLSSAKSVLRDTDYAQEYSTFVGEMIKFQASTVLFAHSHIGANAVLNLLDT